MFLLILERHLLLSRSDGHGGTVMYYYYDVYTWIVAAIALAWIVWFIVSKALRARRLRRPARNVNRRALKRVVKIKRHLSSTYLKPGRWGNIHAIGVGRLEDGR